MATSPLTYYRNGTTPRMGRMMSGDSRDSRRGARFSGLSESELVQVGTALSVAGAGLGAYHGYKRNASIPWAIVWAAAGAIFPIVTIPVAIAQGFSQPGPGAAAAAGG